MAFCMFQDVFQIFIIVGGLLALVIRGLMQTGGLANVWTIAEEVNTFKKLFDRLHSRCMVNPCSRHGGS
jgi:hypothetical protein